MKLTTWLKLFVICLTLLSLIICISFFIGMNKDPNNAIDRPENNTQGTLGTIYKQYQGQIYASVPSNGVYKVDQADAQSFRSISDGFQNRQFAADNKQVYCGNLILPKLDPAQTVSLGNGYISDGKHTFYCANMSEPNQTLGKGTQLYQQLLYAWDLAAKPQTYIYPSFELAPSAQPYRSMLERVIASNGQQTYFAGQLMPQANPNTLRALPKRYNDGDVRDSHVYFADGQHVYYQQHLLDLPDQSDLYSITVDNISQQNYLIAPKQGLAYVDHLAFDPQHAPYRLISTHGAHVLHGLFISQAGVYYYDTQTQRIQRAGDNPFAIGQWDEIAPLIFSNGQETLYLESSERWGSNKNPGLQSRSTHIYQLDESSTDHWQKIATVDHRFGEVWKKGEVFYYFDQLGPTQLIRQTLYRIADPTLVQQLISSEYHPNDIRKLIKSEQLVPVKKQKILTATSTYADASIVIKATLIIFAVLLLLFKLLHKFKLLPQTATDSKPAKSRNPLRASKQRNKP